MVRCDNCNKKLIHWRNYRRTHGFGLGKKEVKIYHFCPDDTCLFMFIDRAIIKYYEEIKQNRGNL